LEPLSEKKEDTEIGKDEPLILKKKTLKPGSKKNGGFVKTSFHSGHMASIMIIYPLIRKMVKKAKKMYFFFLN